MIEIEAFTDLFGFTIADGPSSAAYPWWPTEDEDPEALATIREFHQGSDGQSHRGRWCCIAKDRRRYGFMWWAAPLIRPTAGPADPDPGDA